MGSNAAGTIVGNIDGGLWYNPLTGDMISTIHDKPQVRVFINDVPTKCSGDCTFEWSSASTPTVSSVTPTSGMRTLVCTFYYLLKVKMIEKWEKGKYKI